MAGLHLESAKTTRWLVLVALTVVMRAHLCQGDLMRNATQRATGTVIPWPKHLRYLDGSADNYYTLRQRDFNIIPHVSSKVSECAIVQRAIDRYLGFIFDDRKPEDKDDTRLGRGKKLGRLGMLHLATPKSRPIVCESVPDDKMDESYQLIVKGWGYKNEEGMAIVVANTSWGMLRGLETFSQLVYQLDLSSDQFAVAPVHIEDEPRFPFRGYMLDTARHYVPPETMMKLFDAMAYNKLNVFHWHLVDDQSFPMQSSRYPKLSGETAFRPNMVYTKRDIVQLVDYAADRGIRVVAELDTPGHSYAMRSVPDLLTKCYQPDGRTPNGDLGPIDPTNEAWNKFMLNIVDEFDEVFMDSYFHAGGDEVEFDCWRSNPNVNKWMQQNNITDYKQLSGHYMRQVHEILTKYFNKTVMVWQEMFDDEARLPKDTIVHVWKEDPPHQVELERVLAAGYRALLSSCWYLNYIEYGSDWTKFYQCEPTPDNGPQSELLLGGEICMWTEYVDERNVISRTWPRTSAAAERLWSARDKTDVKEFRHRLEQMRCRLIYRGIDAEPVNGPGYC